MKITYKSQSELEMLLQGARNTIEAIKEFQPKIITWEEIDFLDEVLKEHFNDVEIIS